MGKGGERWDCLAWRREGFRGCYSNVRISDGRV